MSLNWWPNQSDPLRLKLELLGPIPGLKSKELTGSPNIEALSTTVSFDSSRLSDQSSQSHQRQQELWKPLPGPQTQALESLADELFYGGAAGGGKTDLVIGCAVTQHRESIIFRREFPQLRGILERSKKIIGATGRLNEQSYIWRMPDRTIEFGAVKDEDDKEKYQGRPHDLKAFDEITHFTESQFRYIIGWTRTTTPGQRTRVIATGNPPTSTEGQWVISYWAPWLDETYENPAEPGELRWVAVLDGKDVWVDGPEPFDHNGETIYPKSRSFIPARLGDNPYLTRDMSYVAQLQGMQEPMRTQMLYGDFSLGLIADPYQLIPTVALRDAKARTVDVDGVGGVTAGIDVAAGGEAETVLYFRRGNDILSVQVWTDADPRPQVIAALRKWLQSGLVAVNVDSVGNGHYFALDIEREFGEYGVTVTRVNVGMPSDVMDSRGDKRFANLKAEYYWNLRERFVNGEICGLEDQTTLSQLASLRFEQPRGVVTIEKKEDARKRGVKSPDRAEALMLAFAPPSFADTLTRAIQAGW